MRNHLICYFILAMLFSIQTGKAQLICSDLSQHTNGAFYNANQYNAGDLIFMDNDLPVSIENYYYSAGNPVLGSIEIQTWNVDPIEGNAIFMNGGNVAFDFSSLNEPVQFVSFDFWYGGGGVNFNVNGTTHYIENDFTYVNTTPAPGISMTIDTTLISQGGTMVGSITLSGNITSVLAGGGEVFLDNICYETGTVVSDSCVISNVYNQLQPCINGQFYVDLFFTATDPGSSGFTVSGNGTNYGNFNYGQAYYTFGPFQGDGNTDWEFVVSDTDNPNCSGFTEVGFIDCNPTPDTCRILNLVADPLICTSDTTISLYINFNGEDTDGVGFDVFANGTFFGFYDYTNIPLTIQNFPLTGSGSGFVQICDNDNPNCCQTAQFSEPNCTVICHLEELEAAAIECNTDESYILQIEVAQNGYNPIDSFDVFSTGSFLGTFAYGQSPIIIPSFIGSGNLTDEITVCHSTDPNCCLTTTFDALICNDDCFISEIDILAETCEEGEYMVLLDLEYRNPGFLGFQVLGNGINYGIFHYADLPIQLGPFIGDGTSIKEFIVLDQVEPSCANVGMLDPVSCSIASLPILEDDFAKIYTDESSDWLTIELLQDPTSSVKIKLFNSIGKLETATTGLDWNQQKRIDLSKLASGIYILNLEVDGKQWSQKIYRQRN